MVEFVRRDASQGRTVHRIDEREEDQGALIALALQGLHQGGKIGHGYVGTHTVSSMSSTSDSMSG